MGMGFAPTWLRQVTPPLLHKTTLTTVYIYETDYVRYCTVYSGTCNL